MTLRREKQDDGPIRVLCVDDHAFVVEGLAARIAVEDDIVVVGRLASADDLVAEVGRTGADVVLLDIEMPGPDAFGAIQTLHRAHPRVRAILLSAYIRDGYIDAAYRVGAWGYLSKGDSPDSVIEGIRAVARGEPALNEAVRSRLQRERDDLRAEPTSRLGHLTAREREILRLIARGLSRTEIADQLSRSPMTVDNHRKSIMRKLGIHDRAALVRYAIAEGLAEL